MERPTISSQNYESDEFRALASAVIAYERIVQQARTEPVSADPAELLSALSDVGEASLVMVKHAGAL